MAPRCYIYNTLGAPWPPDYVYNALGALRPWQRGAEGGAERNPGPASLRWQIRQLPALCAERLQEESAAVGNPSSLTHGTLEATRLIQ